MGMLGTAIGSALNLGAAELQKDYESQRDVAAKKDLASYEGEIRQRMQDAQNQFTTGERLGKQDFESGQQTQRLTSEEGRAKAINDLGYYNADINQDRNIQEAAFQKSMIGIHQGQLANSAAVLQLQRDQFNNLIKHQDVPDSVKLDVTSLQKQADEYFGRAKDPMASPEDRAKATNLGMAALQSARDRMSQFVPKSDKTDNTAGGADRRAMGGKYGDSGTPSVAEPPAVASTTPSAPTQNESRADLLSQLNQLDPKSPEAQALRDRIKVLDLESVRNFGGMLRRGVGVANQFVNDRLYDFGQGASAIKG